MTIIRTRQLAMEIARYTTEVAASRRGDSRDFEYYLGESYFDFLSEEVFTGYARWIHILFSGWSLFKILTLASIIQCQHCVIFLATPMFPMYILLTFAWALKDDEDDIQIQLPDLYFDPYWIEDEIDTTDD